MKSLDGTQLQNLEVLADIGDKKMKVVNPSVVLSLQASYFEQIYLCLKTVEGRINRPEYSVLKPGDYIKFESKDNQALYAQVLQVKKFPSFRSYLNFFGLNACLPNVQTVEQGEKIYRSFPNYREKELTHGVIGIEFKKIEGEYVQESTSVIQNPTI
jgi:ASC-1-like (ASCH) protein